MKNMLIGLVVVVGLIVAAGFFVGGIYNSLVQSEEGVKEAWAQVENVYQRRLDLIPNLVETVKGYAAHEQKTLTDVIAARSKILSMGVTPNIVNDSQKFSQFENTQAGLTSALSRLLAIAERYPELKANQNFLMLQSQIEGSENRIAVERHRFNEAARQFNTKVRVFPNNLIASVSGFQVKPYFKGDEGAEKAPKVSFS